MNAHLSVRNTYTHRMVFILTALKYEWCAADVNVYFSMLLYMERMVLSCYDSKGDCYGITRSVISIAQRVSNG